MEVIVGFGMDGVKKRRQEDGRPTKSPLGKRIQYCVTISPEANLRIPALKKRLKAATPSELVDKLILGAEL